MNDTQCQMGWKHEDGFCAQQCNIGSTIHACDRRLERIVKSHPDEATRVQAQKVLAGRQQLDSEVQR